MNGRNFISDLGAAGRYSFTTADAQRALGKSSVATRAVLRRLKTHGDIATPFRGFQVILPPEYRKLGCLPGDQFVPQLMDFVGQPYYAGLLTAAELHGAAHQRPQEFQVVTRRNRPEIVCGRVRVVFLARRNVEKVPVETRNTLRGTIRISTPEATAVDLATYPHRCGGIDNVATVLAELGESIDAKRLAAVAAKIGELPALQRLGYLLSRVGMGRRADALKKLVARKARRAVPLLPSAGIGKAGLDVRWQIIVNAEVEPDL